MSIDRENDKEYMSCVHPRENRYYTISLVVSIILWIIFTIVTFGMGLLYVGFGAFAILIGHAVFIANIKGYGMKITERQFPELYTIVKNTSTRLGLQKIPEVYMYNMNGVFNAFAMQVLSRNFIVLTTTIMDACDGDNKKIEFIIAHEMTHLQRKHTKRQAILAPSRLVPWLGNAYSRACENTCDGVAGKFIMNDKEQAIKSALILPTADKKRADAVNIDAYEEQRKESGGFWMTLVEIGASHPFSFNRVAFLRNIFGDDVPKVSRSFWGTLLSPFFSIQMVIGVYIVIIMVFVAKGYMEASENTVSEQSRMSDYSSPYDRNDSIKNEDGYSGSWDTEYSSENTTPSER
ncbi:MAG: M48 family metallopeptidase [Candidatus Gracilibacteria bacterium]|nr:M48 family metallopeptidase [Candidatus Gracilibacteria bacterium]